MPLTIKTARLVHEALLSLWQELEHHQTSMLYPGLTPLQHLVLSQLHQHPGLDMAELGRQLGMDAARIRRKVNGLVKKGLLVRKPLAGSPRGATYTLPEEVGLRLNTSLDQATESLFPLLKELEADERRALKQALPKLTKALRHQRKTADILLRPIAREDNTAVRDIVRAVMTEYACVGEGYSIQDAELGDMYQAYRNDRSCFFVLEKAGRLVGCGGFAPLQGGDLYTCELRKMYFLPEARGLGLGSRLLKLCVERARDLGYRRIYLETVSRMEKANMLYQQAGFKRLDKPMGETGHSSCELWYALDL